MIPLLSILSLFPLLDPSYGLINGNAIGNRNPSTANWIYALYESNLWSSSRKQQSNWHLLFSFPLQHYRSDVSHKKSFAINASEFRCYRIQHCEGTTHTVLCGSLWQRQGASSSCGCKRHHHPMNKYVTLIRSSWKNLSRLLLSELNFWWWGWHELPWLWRQQGPPKRRYPTMTLHGVTTQTTSSSIFTTVKTTYLAQSMNYIN
jgi:hypothetical protein